MKSSRIKTAFQIEAVVTLAVLCVWILLSLAYDDQIGAFFLDGPALPLAAGTLIVGSIVVTWSLRKRDSLELRILSYTATSARFVIVVAICLLVTWELSELSGLVSTAPVPS
ncbi:hypothetical protein GCM10023194_39180 [Planotetraspora phitsanulokensis]|uniref:Uncharacterized protein n=1 Tax=Planotetraspora phitsanulokensis TaxID=575192 RepID=A0A8J3XHW7_9ACTN|nr:hypothetical protein [Planotetraspora phitsanulokensis]GII41555.1 hypothetical protein Pph01_65580 [Planotetraspora phitsanulokensis]